MRYFYTSNERTKNTSEFYQSERKSIAISLDCEDFRIVIFIVLFS